MWRGMYSLDIGGQKQVKPRKVRRFRQLSIKSTTALVRIYGTVSRFPLPNSLIFSKYMIKCSCLHVLFRLSFRDYIRGYS